MANNDVQLILEFLVRDLGSQKFQEITDKAHKMGGDVSKAFDQATKHGEEHQKSLATTTRGVEALGESFKEHLGPAGAHVGRVFDEVTRLGGGLESMIEKVGLSGAALTTLGLGALAVGGVVVALSHAAEEAEHLDKALANAASRSKDFEETKRALLETSKRISNEAGLPQGDVATAVRAASNAFPGDKESAFKFLQGPELAAIADPLANIGDLTQKAIPLFKQFNIGADDTVQAFNDLTVAARDGKDTVSNLLETMVQAAPISRAMGISFRDALSLIGSAQAQGADPDKARLGFQRLLEVINDAGNAAHVRLAALGVDFSQAKSGGAGVARVIEDINQKVAENGGQKTFASIFPGVREQSAIKTFLDVTSSNLGKFQLDFVADANLLREAAQNVGSEPGAALARTGEQMKNEMTDLGRVLHEATASVFGTKLDLPVRIVVPESFTEALSRVRDDVAAGNLEAAKRDLAEAHEIGDKAGELYIKAYMAAAFREQTKLAQQANTRAQQNRDPEGHEKIQTFEPSQFYVEPKGLSEKQFVDQVNAGLIAAQRVVDGARPVEIPATVVVTHDLPAQLDLLQSDIERALRALDIAPIEFRPKVLPPNVQQAQKALADVEDQLKSPDGTRKSTAALDTADQTRARDAVQTILTYYQSVVQLQRTSLGIDAQIGGSLDKQVAQHQLVLQSIRDGLADLRLGPDAVDKVSAKLPKLAADFARLEDLGTQQAGLDVQAKTLAAREKSLSTARDMARAVGDLAGADVLDAQVIKTKANEQRTAIQLAQIAAHVQFGNDAATMKAIDDIVAAQLKEVGNSQRLAELARQRAVEERNLGTALRISAANDDLATGLDKELLAIRRNRAEREKSDQQARRTGQFVVSDADFARVLSFYDKVEQRDEALARRNALVSQVETIAGAISSATDAYGDQARAIELTRGAERLRVEETLRGAGAEKDAIAQTLELYDRATRLQIQRAAIGAAGKSSAAVAEERLLADAFDEAQRAATGFHDSEEQRWQREIDLVSEAKDGARAWGDGWRAGADDAIRALNDFDNAVAASRDLTIGFRDSIVEALTEIGQHGKDPFKDFLVANLQNVQKQAATLFANTVTKGIFGPSDTNKADPLEQSGQALFQAGNELLNAATDLQSAAFALGAQPPLPSPGTGNNLNEYPTVAGDQAPADGIDQAAQHVDASGRAFEQAATSAGSAFGSSVVQSGDAFGASLASFLGSLGHSAGTGISNFITSLIPTGATPAAHAFGGIVHGETPDGPSPRANAHGGVYTSRTFIEVAEAGNEEAVIPLRGGAVPVDLRQPTPSRARVERSQGPSSIQVGGHTFNLGGITIHATGDAANDPDALARMVAQQTRRTLIEALDGRQDARIFDLVRRAQR